MVDLMLLVPTKIMKIDMSGMGIRKDRLDMANPLDVVFDFQRLAQAISIKLVNRGFKALSKASPTEFSSIAAYVVAQVRDSIRSEQDDLESDGYSMPNSEKLLDLKVANCDPASRVISVNVTTLDQAGSFLIGFQS